MRFPLSCRKLCSQGGYVLPDLSTLLTSYLQEQELQRLREKAVIAHKLLEDEGKRIRKLMTTFSTRSASNSFEGNCYYQNNSLAEKTLEAHSTPRPDKPQVKGTDGKIYPKNPSNRYISRFPDDLTGCLGCGSTEHRFRGCPRSNEKTYANLFGKNCGFTFLPLERKRAHLLPQPTVLFPSLLFFLTITLPFHLPLGIAYLFHVPTLTLLLGKSIKMPSVHVFLLYWSYF